LRKISQLLKFEEKGTGQDGEEEAQENEKKESSVQNIQELFLTLKHAGIDFGQDQAHLIQKSLNELAFGTGAKSVRLFGKI